MKCIETNAFDNIRIYIRNIRFGIAGYTDGLGISLISINGLIAMILAATGLIMFYKGLADYIGRR